MSFSRLVRTLVEGNDSGKVYWVKVTSKYEGRPQDQWEFVLCSKDLGFMYLES